MVRTVLGACVTQAQSYDAAENADEHNHRHGATVASATRAFYVGVIGVENKG